MNYHTAIQEIEALMVHFRSRGQVSCAEAEQEDQILIRLNDLKHTLREHDQATFKRIHQYYQQHISK